MTRQGVGVLQAGASRVRIAEASVDAIKAEDVRQLLDAFLRAGRPHHVVTVNLDFVHKAGLAPAFRNVINAADLNVVDGKPLVWLVRRLGLPCDRVTGPDIIEMLCSLSQRHGYRIFLLGGAAGVAQAAASRLEQAFPGARICGAYSPPAAAYPFPAVIEAGIAERIRDARPDVLLVAFGCPKQEFWIHDHLREVGARVCVGVGGSFDFIAGRVARAPLVVQKLGLEWLFRLSQEPRRLWRRYLWDDLPFIARLLALHFLASMRIVRRPVLQIVEQGG